MNLSKQWRKVAVTLAATMLGGCAGFGQNSLQSDTISSLKASFNTNRSTLIDVYYTDKAQLSELAASGMDIWTVQKGYARGLVTEDQLATLQKHNLSFKKVSDRSTRAFDANYTTYSELVTDIQALAAKYPNICQLKDIGDSWEKTQKMADRDIWALKLGTGDTSKKPAVLFVGNHHAREIVTLEVVLRMAHLLCEQYGTDPEITSYVDTREIWLVPTANPDGHIRAEKGQMWRKNTDTSYGGGNYGGVDLNRNYGYLWGGAGTSSNPSSDTFRGPKAFSEPETQAMRDLMLSRDFSFLLTFHSYGNYIMWPWNSTNNPPADQRLPAIGKKMGTFTPSYTAMQGNELYLTTGDDTDWAYGERKIIPYCIEIGNEFMPPSSSLNKHFADVKPFMMYALKIADNPARVYGPELTVSSVGTVQPSDNIARVEYFLDRPGQDGTGNTIAEGSSIRTIKAAGRHLAYVHAKGSNGQWGPFEKVWID